MARSIGRLSAPQGNACWERPSGGSRHDVTDRARSRRPRRWCPRAHSSWGAYAARWHGLGSAGEANGGSVDFGALWRCAVDTASDHKRVLLLDGSATCAQTAPSDELRQPRSPVNRLAAGERPSPAKSPGRVRRIARRHRERLRATLLVRDDDTFLRMALGAGPGGPGRPAVDQRWRPPLPAGLWRSMPPRSRPGDARPPMRDRRAGGPWGGPMDGNAQPLLV